jgi:hypothetical protein
MLAPSQLDFRGTNGGNMKQFRPLEWAIIVLTVVISLGLIALIALTPDQQLENTQLQTRPLLPTEASWPDVSPDDVQYLSQRFNFGELQIALFAFHQTPDTNSRNDYCLVNVSTAESGQITGRLLGSMYGGNEYYPLLDYTARLAANLDDVTRPMAILPEATNEYSDQPSGDWSFSGQGTVRLLIWGSKQFVINELDLLMDCSQQRVSVAVVRP